MIYFNIFILVLCGIAIIKNFVTYHNHKIIDDAIFRYRIDMINHGSFDYQVDWSDEEPYDKTLYRLWDWGYKRILPPDKFEIIKPYIRKK